MTIEAPGAHREEGQYAFRPTTLMQRASLVVEAHPGELTKNKVAQQTGGNKQAALAGIDILQAEGYLRTTPGRAGHPVYESVKPYREADERHTGGG